MASTRSPDQPSVSGARFSVIEAANSAMTPRSASCSGSAGATVSPRR